MEVHHHSHSSAHGNHKGNKKWTHYLWEFIMLFLAVFCGFLAENQREHMVEHWREKEFIKSMIADLQDDTTILQNSMSSIRSGSMRLDSLVTILGDKNIIKERGDQLYYFGRVAPRLATLSNNNRTFEQLKNSGGFRLIRNTTASNKIMDYYNSIPIIHQLEDIYAKEFDEYKVLASKIFEPDVFRMMETVDGNVARGTTNPPLRSYDPELLKQISVFAIYMNGSYKGLIMFQRDLRKRGVELIELLKKEYHID